MTFAFRHRNDLDTMPASNAGSPQPLIRDRFQLSNNESPFDPLPSVRKAIADDCLPFIGRYPDFRGWDVISRLSERFGVGMDSIILGCGSSEVLRMAICSLAGPGDEVIIPWRSFEAYPALIAASGATCVKVPLTADLRHDVDAMAAAVNDRTRLIIINNPNNPTGTTVSADEAERLMQSVPGDVMVLFDEAYVQFNNDPGAADGMALLRKYPNVIVAQTFSKAYGLAGLRVGYGIARPEVIGELGKTALAFAVTDVAQRAAVASMDAQDELDERVERVIAERNRVTVALRGQGWDVPDSGSNYLWLGLGDHTDCVAAVFRDAGIEVHVFPGSGIRISMGLPEVNDAVIAACATAKQLYDAECAAA